MPLKRPPSKAAQDSRPTLRNEPRNRRRSLPLLAAGLLVLASAFVPTGASAHSGGSKATGPRPAETASAAAVRPEIPSPCAKDDLKCRAFVRADDETMTFSDIDAFGNDWTGKPVWFLRTEADRKAFRTMRCLSYVAWAEARDDGAKGMELVMRVVLNRARAGVTGQDVCAVVSARGQFEPMTKRHAAPVMAAAKAEGAIPPDIRPAKADPEESAHAVEARSIAWQLVLGMAEPDPTDGAMYFMAPKAQKALGRHTPTWARNDRKTFAFGHHVFYRAKPVQVAMAGPVR